MRPVRELFSVIAVGAIVATTMAGSAKAMPFIGASAIEAAAPSHVADIRWRGWSWGPGLGIGLAAGLLGAAASADAYWDRSSYCSRPYGWGYAPRYSYYPYGYDRAYAYYTPSYTYRQARYPYYRSYDSPRITRYGYRWHRPHHYRRHHAWHRPAYRSHRWSWRHHRHDGRHLGYGGRRSLAVRHIGAPLRGRHHVWRHQIVRR